ncbi:hypothetical protein BKE30_11885 [Alkanindiges hydrocarboniclasticus]|uniref:Uncharacterized protein n=1 Tax=Alkanindiges hydrocarboniclasticus TaxID=1907941 RepID=A0A1S8CTS5_9GAMM|nr:hypothetical protein [Alkanindiges hydrocarboniclasticus]ONG38634.1 hypothetical protein BKE30_11885 [Alkanindiges hydrocarboniclasticus]
MKNFFSKFIVGILCIPGVVFAQDPLKVESNDLAVGTLLGFVSGVEDMKKVCDVIDRDSKLSNAQALNKWHTRNISVLNDLTLIKENYLHDISQGDPYKYLKADIFMKNKENDSLIMALNYLFKQPYEQQLDMCRQWNHDLSSGAKDIESVMGSQLKQARKAYLEKKN